MNQTAQDPYRSRDGQPEKIVPRADPVVHARSATGSAIDEQRVHKFERDGFFVLDCLFSEEEVACFQREAERLRNDPELTQREETIVEPGSNAIRSIFDLPRFSPVFQKLMHDARLVRWARHLLDDDVYVHQSRLNYKPGFAGKPFQWHSDFETWHIEDGMPRMRALSVSIALTDNRASNGPVMVIPGSHKHYVACGGHTPDNNYTQSLRRQEYGVPSERALTQLCEGRDIDIITGRAGSVLLFDCNAMHGSAGNMTPFPRNNLFFVYNAMSNRLAEPFSGQPPRPEHIAHRSNLRAVEPIGFHAADYLSTACVA
jgi:ectoine hydroxylase